MLGAIFGAFFPSFYIVVFVFVSLFLMTIRTYFKARDIYYKHKESQRESKFGYQDVEAGEEENKEEENDENTESKLIINLSIIFLKI